MHVVLIGARPEAARALLDGGHRVTLLYEGTEHARLPALRARLAHACAVDSYLVVESLWSALHHVGALADGVDAVVSVQEHGMVPAALLGRLLGARALAPELALRCRDKALQKAAWRAAGVPTADWLVLPDAGAEAEPVSRTVARAGVTAPYVVKPTAGAATIGVAAAADGPALDRLAAELIADSQTRRRLLVESRVPGDEWHADGLVRDGALEALLVSRYRTPLIETKQGHPSSTVSLLPRRHPEVYREVADLTRRALAALGHGDGVFHFEFFGAPGAFTAGELAARPGGHYIGALVQRVLGVDIWAAAARILLGEPVPVAAGAGQRVVGFTDIPTVAGRPNRLTREEVESIPGVVELEIKIPPGEVMPDMSANSGIRIGTALVEAATEQDCLAALDQVTETALKANQAP
ncbi:hypothetical protein [Kitasatospora sp. NBC_01266]|uniref:hypothetical protein n=1 Tax=Kitasatospora sp. NBC_01266 TaxID=2903572 RepID=UPI002E36395B|nr:hypothetical protein [Kitasatospora sp. NBC_01266]